MGIILTILSNIVNEVNGLNQKTNYYISTDSQRLVWISSTDGVYIYNGLNARKLIPKNKNLQDNNIQSFFYEDSEQRVWFSSFQSFYSFEKSTTKLNIHEISSSNETVDHNYKILNLIDSILVLRAGKTLNLFNINSEKNETFEIDLSQYNSFTCYKEESSIFLFCGNQNKLLQIKININNHLNKISVIEKNIPTFAIEYFKNKIYTLSIDDKLLEIEPSDLKIISETTHSKITSIHSHKDSIFYLIFKDHYTKVTNIHKKNESEVQYFSDSKKQVVSALVDNNENEWFSKDGLGLFFKNQEKLKFNTIKPYNINARTILEFNNKLWIGTLDKGVFCIDLKTKEFKNYNTSNGLKHNFIEHIIVSEKEEMFITSQYSILKYNSFNDKFEKVNILDSYNYFFSIECTKDDLYVITDDKIGLKKLLQVENQFKLLDLHFKEKINYEILNLKHDTLNRFFLDLGNVKIGYYEMRNDTFHRIKTLNIPGGIKDIKKLNSKYYFSTKEGIFESDYTMNNINKLNNNLLNQTIYKILPHKEYLYLSSNQGILRYNTIDSTVHQFTLADGIQGLEFNTTAGMIDSKGRYIFGGTNGINVFYPDSIKFLDYNTPIHLSNILINDDEYDWETNISLKDSIQFDYENNTLTFKFHGIDYSDPKAVELKCKMENYDDDWIYFDINDGSMRYANLPPGHYTFKMQATNSDKVWSTDIKEIDVVITPPFWQTWWFRLATLLTIAGIIWFTFKSYYKRQLVKKDLELREQRLAFEKQQALQNERNRIAAEMHDDLGGGLTSIKFLAHRIQKKKADINPNDLVDKIINQSGELINNMSEIIWAMNSGFDTLNNLVAYIRNHIKKQCQTFGITYSEDIPSIIPSTEVTGQKRRNSFLVMKEAMHNITKHANASNVKMVVIVDTDQLTIKLSDNGDGISEENQFGNGLKNMAKRMTDIGGTFNIENNKGTQITITTPL